MLQRACGELLALKNVVVINDEAHHCYREKPDDDEESEPQGRGEGGGQGEQRGGAALDLRHRGAEAQGRAARRLRPLRHAVLPARLGLRRGHAVPVGGLRLLADGRHRVRHRQAAARAGGRQCASMPTCRCSANLWDHIGKRDAQEGRGQVGRPRSALAADAAADRAPLPLQPLQQGVSRSGSGRHRRCRRCSSSCATTPPPRSSSTSGSPAGSARARTARSGPDALAAIWSCSATTTSTAIRLPRPEHAADRQRADRIRRGARQGLPRAWPRPRSSSSAARSAARGRRSSRRRASPTPSCCARS